MTATATHTPRAQAVLSHATTRVVTLDELATIPAGSPLGPHHRPVPHLQLVTGVKQAFTRRGYAIAGEQFSVSHDGARLFGTLDLVAGDGAPLLEGLGGGMAVGLRHANDQAFALGVIAGLRVFVCDNLCFTGGERLLRRKHTTGLELEAEIERGLDRTIDAYGGLTQLMHELRDTRLSDSAAKLLIYNLALDGGVIAPSQLGKVHAWYFSPETVAADEDRERGFADVEPRTVWGVMNAVTRVARTFAQPRQQECGTALTRYLGRYLRQHQPTAPSAN